MTKAEDFDIVGSFNNQQFTTIDAERSVNLFEYRDALGKKPKALINTSGLINTNITFSGATGGFRAEFVFLDTHYVVIGNSVYAISSSGASSLLGTISNATGYVGIDANTFQVIFVNGEDGYIWDTNADTFTQITDSSFPANPVDVCYLDGFFVVANGTTNNFQLSEFNQGLVWGPASNQFVTFFAVNSQLLVGNSTIGGPPGTPNFQTGVPVTVSSTGASVSSPLVSGTTYYSIFIDATHIELATTYDNAIAGIPIVLNGDGSPVQSVTSNGQLQQGSMTSHPGTIVACRTLHRRLFLLSQYYTEVWENAGIGTNLPFRRNNALLMEYGTPAIGSIAVSFDKMFFLSQDRDGLGAVMEVVGSQSVPVSNRALDSILAQYAVLGQIVDCRSFLIKENGLIFYRMNFTAANHTYVYGVTSSDPTQDQSKLWHEEEVLNGNRHPSQTHAYFNGINYVGDYLTPILYQVDRATYTNNLEAIRRMRITRSIVPPGYQRIRIDRLQIDMLQGNVAELENELLDQELATENLFLIETENGDDILLEQSLTVAQPDHPYIFLSVSKDGGQTYGYKVRTPMGFVGQRTFRSLWRKLGTTKRGQPFVAKFEFYDPIPCIILGAAWAYEVLPE